jgi:hypothetical protein
VRIGVPIAMSFLANALGAFVFGVAGWLVTHLIANPC